MHQHSVGLRRLWRLQRRLRWTKLWYFILFFLFKPSQQNNLLCRYLYELVCSYSVEILYQINWTWGFLSSLTIYQGLNFFFSDKLSIRQNNCNSTIGKYLCDNNKCVSLSIVCNGHDDCGDGTDEDPVECAKGWLFYTSYILRVRFTLYFIEKFSFIFFSSKNVRRNTPLSANMLTNSERLSMFL